MSVELDPSCQEAAAMRLRQKRRAGLMGTAVGEGHLAEVIQQTQERLEGEHFGACAKCRAYADRPRLVPMCPWCGAEMPGETCANGGHFWRRLFGKRVKPAAKPARRVPVQSEPAPAPPKPKPRAEPVAEPPEPAHAPAPEAAPPPRRPKPTTPPRPQAAPRPPLNTKSAMPPRKPAARAKAKGPAPHAVLGVAADATADEVKAAYREKVQQYHPDKVARLAPEFKELAEAKMRELNEAHDKMRAKLKKSA